MKHIKQKHKLGCTIACLAMLADITYEEALQVMHPKRKSHQKACANINQIAQALHRLNLAFKAHFLPTLDNLERPALLILSKRNIDSAYNHAVIWDPENKRILDPDRHKPLSLNTYKKRTMFALELY